LLYPCRYQADGFCGQNYQQLVEIRGANPSGLQKLPVSRCRTIECTLRNVIPVLALIFAIVEYTKNYKIMSTGKFIGGLMIGTAVGLATGLLIAPTSGNHTRRNIARKSRAYSQQAVDAVRQYLENIKQGKGKPMDTSITADELLNRYSSESSI
jgi:gas vesicle protein